MTATADWVVKLSYLEKAGNGHEMRVHKVNR